MYVRKKKVAGFLAIKNFQVTIGKPDEVLIWLSLHDTFYFTQVQNVLQCNKLTLIFFFMKSVCLYQKQENIFFFKLQY